MNLFMTILRANFMQLLLNFLCLFFLFLFVSLLELVKLINKKMDIFHAVNVEGLSDGINLNSKLLFV